MGKITEEQIETALDISRKSPVQKKFGALLVYRGRIISTGYNHYSDGLPSNIKQCLLRV